jgi:hypothetical protein
MQSFIESFGLESTKFILNFAAYLTNEAVLGIVAAAIFAVALPLFEMHIGQKQ